MKKMSRNLKSTTKFLTSKPEGILPEEAKKNYQKQQDLLFALQQVSKVLTAEVSLQKILEEMALIIAKAIGAKWVNFWTLTPDKKSVQITAHYGMQKEYMENSQRHPLRLGTGWVGRAVETGQTWGTSDIIKDPILKELGPEWEKHIKKQDYRGLLCVPLSSAGNIVGGLCSYFKNVHKFTDFEMRLLTVAANQAATAITNSQIFGELLAERNKSMSMINSLSDGLISYDLDNKIIAFNPKSEEMLWVRRDQILNKTVPALSKNNFLLKNILDISLLSIEDFATKEYILEKPRRIFLKITQLPVRDANKKIGSMRVLHDITNEKEAEELKSNFVSVASHQLRTPLSRIKWAIDTILKGDLGELKPDQNDMLKKLLQETNQMISLIQDLLDASRIEEGRFKYGFTSVDVFELVKKAVAGFQPAAKERKLEIVTNKPDGQLSKISADPDKLTMAIQNIIDNAIRYSYPGKKIYINFTQGHKTQIIEFKDSGIGIPRNQIKFIFRRFFRASNAIRMETDGSGLGLWIANEIIKQHNGRIYFDSEENKGSAFSIQLPLDPRPTQEDKLKNS